MAEWVGMILGLQLEENLRRALLLPDGDFRVFVTWPISSSNAWLYPALGE